MILITGGLDSIESHTARNENTASTRAENRESRRHREHNRYQGADSTAG